MSVVPVNLFWLMHIKMQQNSMRKCNSNIFPKMGSVLNYQDELFPYVPVL
jgi:hypothetical protein